MLAASELFKAGRVPNGWLPALILIFLSIYGLSRWFFDSEPARGFLPVVNLLAGALAFSAVLAGIKSTSARVILVLILVLGGVLQAIQIALWRSFGSGIETPWFSELLRSWYEGRINPRLSGSYMSRNNTVWALNSSCLFCLALCIWARWPAFLKFLCGWFSGLLALTSFLTLSRGGILGLALGFSLFLGLSLSIIIKSKGRFRIAALAMTIILLIGVVGAGSWFLANNFLLKERVERVGEDAYRSEAWKPLLRQIQLAPLWGTGPGSTAHWMRILHSPQLAGTESIYAHNDWLEFTAEGGIFALVLLLVALSLSVSIALHGIHSRLISKPDYGIPQSTEAALGIGALCSIAAFAIHSFFDYNMQLSSNSLLAFLILGIAVGTRSPQQAADELDRANPILSTSLSASSLFLLPGLAILLTFRNFHDETRATQIDNAIRLKRPEIALALAKRVEIS
ncbi:MAG: O-antigen ligase family protein, partial [Chthoniobacterales bacterium]|nr:O-antigen ligase family protein [Chthoniobacterales bacterium]